MTGESLIPDPRTVKRALDRAAALTRLLRALLRLSLRREADLLRLGGDNVSATRAGGARRRGRGGP